MEMGFLKGKSSLGKVLDIGCGLSFTALLLKLTSARLSILEELRSLYLELKIERF